MVAISFTLMVIANKQQWSGMHAGWGMGWDVPARTANALLNGPGFAFAPGFLASSYPWVEYDGHRLISIGLLWFMVGFVLDRRGTIKFHQQNVHLARASFTTAAVIGGGWTGMAIYAITQNVNIPAYWKLLFTHPQAREHFLCMSWVGSVGLTLWVCGLALYFSVKAWAAWRFPVRAKIG